MTIRELYQNIGGDYDQAIRVLMMDKLIDKHIKKFVDNGVVDGLLAAGESMNPNDLFEMSHAVKGVTANLGLVSISTAASELCEEYRPGNERKLSDEEVKTRIGVIRDMYNKTVEEIKKYEEQ